MMLMSSQRQGDLEEEEDSQDEIEPTLESIDYIDEEGTCYRLVPEEILVNMQTGGEEGRYTGRPTGSNTLYYEKDQ
ncbi:hypothetical protein L202_01944 [Cryptococcus amylolentus CBS 6039]|uniref:Uncharacterized protein n=1 Tax=Cryptococcus amylolentus CBS 6039 TaxID=1295533 RepID=A0A1E3HYT5_9TREE|nr:hypothetical protein L202_01944 [Cryptococcus amylolentus CBS 6039]ODN81523.1 hypothetical protein L202_01944 [Cryptococcus amylolentus CBS 6039]